MGSTESSKSKWFWLFVIPLAGTLLGALAVNYLFPQWFGAPDGLAVAVSWPAMEVCDGTAVAGAPGAADPAVSSSQQIDRAAAAAENGGGAWASGNLTLLVTPSGDKQVVVSSITPKVTRVDDTPAWIFSTLAQCGGMSYREFALDLDSSTLTDNGVLGSSQVGSAAPEAVGGNAFVVDAEQAASVVIAASACRGNYDFWLDIAYTVSGSSAVEHEEVGPYRVYGDEAILANPEVEVLGNPETGPPTLSYRCENQTAPPSTSPSSTPSFAATATPGAVVTESSLGSILIPAGACGDGETFGWDQRYPIQLVGGRGEAFDAAGLGAGILDSRFVGAHDIDHDGQDDAVLVVDCTGTPEENCCAGRASITSVVLVLDVSRATPVLIGEPITATSVDVGGRDEFREIAGEYVTLRDSDLLVYQRLVYPEELDPAAVEAAEGWYRYTFDNGRWTGVSFD